MIQEAIEPDQIKEKNCGYRKIKVQHYSYTEENSNYELNKMMAKKLIYYQWRLVLK